MYRYTCRRVALIVSFCLSLLISTPGTALEQDKMTLFQLSQVVAKQLDYAIIFSPRVRKNNRIGLVLSEPLENDSLYNVFLAILNSQGYAAVKNGSVIRIVREFKARSLASSS